MSKLDTIDKAFLGVLGFVVGVVVLAVTLNVVADYVKEREKTRAYYECLRVQERAVNSALDAGVQFVNAPSCWR